jgi:hypothetical protein
LVRASSRMPTAATRQRPLDTRGKVISSAKHSAAESRSNTELHTGIRIASANITTRARSKPCRPPGVSSTTRVMPAGGRKVFFGSTVQPTMGACSGRFCARRSLSRAWADCWRSTSPSITGMPWLAQ